MNPIEVLGLTAAAFTTGSFLPQVVRLCRTRNADGISLLTFTIFSAGVALWLVYGVLIHSLSIIVANVVTFVLAIAVVVLVVRIRAERASKSPRTK
jgi:MtN3 and saliva related transmembrane protein